MRFSVSVIVNVTEISLVMTK